MKWIDVTLSMGDQMPCWPGDQPFQREIQAEIGKGGPCNLSRISTGLHAGTHVDAPFHFIADGKRVDELDLELLMGPCRVIELPLHKKTIEKQDLEALVPKGTTRLLVKTANGGLLHQKEFYKDFVAFSPAAIEWLLEQGVRLLGIDYLSIAPYGDDGTVHRLFLRSNETVALEGLDLTEVKPGHYYLICLPMKVQGADGAPARVLLGREE